MGIQPTELSEQDISVEPDVVKQEIAGRSPVQIAMGRIRSDKIALLCIVVVIVFVLIAVFAPLLTDLFGVELEGRRPVRGPRPVQLPDHRSPGPRVHLGGAARSGAQQR